MIRKRLATLVFLSTAAAVLLVPAVAYAQEGDGTAIAGKAIAAALAMGLSALAAGWAQSKIGSAGQATLVERPEERVWALILTALPEVIVLLGFVMAILISGGE